MAGFLLGAFAGGVLVQRLGHHRGLLLRDVVAVELGLVAVATLVTLTVDQPFGTAPAIVLSALCALAMGLQNSMARKLAVPDLTTTVLTMTLTGLAVDARSGGWRVVLRRVIAVAAMLGGAFVGTVLVRHAGVGWALALVLLILVLVTAVSARASRHPRSWQ